MLQRLYDNLQLQVRLEMLVTIPVGQDEAAKGGLPPPWYRPPPEVTRGPTRTRASIIFGPLISNDEGRRWFKDEYDYELASHHRQDYTVPYRLRELFQQKGIAFGCIMAPRRLGGVNDFLVITQILEGPFIHDGPYGYEEVFEEDRKPIPGVLEEEVKAQLTKEFGKLPCVTAPIYLLFFQGLRRLGSRATTLTHTSDYIFHIDMTIEVVSHNDPFVMMIRGIEQNREDRKEFKEN
jgi:hypothetical protein